MVKRQQNNERLLQSERLLLKPKSGGGQLRYEVWGLVNGKKTQVTRYNIAYINPLVFSGDNGRVLGFDNAHGYHHRHFMGQVEAVEFESYEATAERFQSEWSALVQSIMKDAK